jgi:urea carboxylase
VASRHVREADEAYCIGLALAADSYLRQDVILQVARDCGAQAIHPATASCPRTRASPSLRSRRHRLHRPQRGACVAFGLKHTARELAEACQVPLLPGRAC